jgi:hypothetical protein
LLAIIKVQLSAGERQHRHQPQQKNMNRHVRRHATWVKSNQITHCFYSVP